MRAAEVLVEMPELRFAHGRNGRLAYQQWGEGVDVVGVPPLAQNIELSWEWPATVRMFERFGRLGRYVHFDKRGTGASDRLRGVPTLEERVEDMRLVMDDAGIERAHLMGFSDGGATTLLFAAAYPDRVHSLVLFGAGASTFPFDPSPQERARRAASFPGQAQLWGTPQSPWGDALAPSAAGDPAFRRWQQRYERACCDAETLLDLIEMSAATDVRGVCRDVHVPVLLLHRTGDRIVDVELSRQTAPLLPDATLVELEGEDHIAWAGDMDAALDEMERWIRGAVTHDHPMPPTKPRVRIVTLGRFAVEVDDVEVAAGDWGSRHARTIVKRLAVARGWPVTRDELFELLWPGETDRTKVGARLSVQLSTVRRVLRGGVLADRETVRLDLDEVDLDLAMFEAATDDAGVVAAWTGEFLPGDTDLQWTAATRAEVAARAAATGARTADRHLADGLPGLAARVARRLTAANPLDLRAHEVLVTALLDTDQHDEAAVAHAAWSEAAAALGMRVPPLEPG